MSTRRKADDEGSFVAPPSSWVNHIPVLYQEIISGLQPHSGGRYIDGTVGAGGHAFGLLQASSPDGELLGLDRDPAALAAAAERLRPFGRRARLEQQSYLGMADAARRLGWQAVEGIVLDLGLSSLQLEDAARGFAFKHDGPLDMRYDRSSPLTASDLVNGASPDELADVLYRFGEEPAGRRIARAIVAARPIAGTRQLAEVVAAAVNRRPGRGEVHPATRTFQALRIAVNGELEAVAAVLPVAVGLLAAGGRLAVISFHSLEDRAVKSYFHREARDCVCPPEQPVCTCGHRATIKEMTRKPMAPTSGETAQNPRSRSAKLRIIEKLVLA
nr:16S rRNA (cytosine(1402)-N(4))-methyltransferase RsmH [Chloroflexota bacterium]